MLFSENEMFSDNQSITVTAVSTNVLRLKLGTRTDFSTPIEVIAQVVDDFAGGTSVQVELQFDTQEDFLSGAVSVPYKTDDVPVASLVAGYQFQLTVLPKDIKEYCRLRYVVTGGPTAGKVDAGLTTERQTNNM